MTVVISVYISLRFPFAFSGAMSVLTDMRIRARFVGGARSVRDTQEQISGYSTFSQFFLNTCRFSVAPLVYIWKGL
jgi:hypothetical protein